MKKKDNLVKVTLFGELGQYIGAEEWELCVNSVQTAIRALNTLTQNKFNEFFIKNDKLKAKYRVLINGQDFTSPVGELNETNWEKFRETELVMIKQDLKTIDIVPLIESAGRIGGIIDAILGVILIVVGIVLIAYGGWALIIAGLTLLGAGVVALLSRPPDFNYNQNLDNSVSQSYLFNGPQNTVGEGNPIPIGYGTTLVGSNVISAAFKITEFQTTNNLNN